MIKSKNKAQIKLANVIFGDIFPDNPEKQMIAFAETFGEIFHEWWNDGRKSWDIGSLVAIFQQEFHDEIMAEQYRAMGMDPEPDDSEKDPMTALSNMAEVEKEAIKRIRNGDYSQYGDHLRIVRDLMAQFPNIDRDMAEEMVRDAIELKAKELWLF